MKIRKFNENTSIYEIDWETILPESFDVIVDGTPITYYYSEIMVNYDMVQIPYINKKWAFPDCLEFDFYFLNNGNLKINVDITYGDLMVFEFGVQPPDDVSLIYKANTSFSFTETSIKQMSDLLNKFKEVKTSSEDLKFLNKS